MNVHLQLFRCLTPLHHGAGEGRGRIDAPLLRESWNSEPFLLSSSLRGKGRLYSKGDSAITTAFGPERGTTTTYKDGHHGSLAWTDPRLLFLPVRSRFGTTAYLTSWLALARLGQYAEWAGCAQLMESITELLTKIADAVLRPNRAIGCYSNPHWMDTVLRVPGRPYFFFDDMGMVLDRAGEDDKDLGASLFDTVTLLANALFSEGASGEAMTLPRQAWCSRVLLVDAPLFEKALRRCTAVEPATAVNVSGTAKDGSLRFTEFLPEGAILVGLLMNDGDSDSSAASNIRKKLSARLLALGAHSTGGKGLVAAREFVEGTS